MRRSVAVPAARSSCPVMHHSQAVAPWQIFDQNFALGLHDDHILPFNWFNNFRPQRLHSGQESGRSQIECTRDTFQVKLDVQHFAPHEVNVKVVDDHVVITGEHQERQDDHGYISRSFIRKYQLPEDVKDEDVSCSMSSDGVLVVSAKRHTASAHEEKGKPIPITQTGKPDVPVCPAKPAVAVCPGKADAQQNGGADKKAKE